MSPLSRPLSACLLWSFPALLGMAMDEERIGEEMRPSPERASRVTAHLDGSINQSDHNMYASFSFPTLLPPLLCVPFGGRPLNGHDLALI